MKEENLTRLAELIKEIKFTMLTTVDNLGGLHSRPMVTLDFDTATFDGSIYFFTHSDTAKVHDIEHAKEINLAYLRPQKQQYLSVSGKASLHRDKKMMKDLWQAELKEWFPQGIDDPDISLIKVDIESAELWDSKPGKVFQLFGKVKSILNGKSSGSADQNFHI
jgi:general stress protein 26